jgi:FkbM family methyltransferase
MSLSTKINGIKDIWQFDNRWHLIFTRLFFPDEQLMFYKFRNVEFVTDHLAGDANGAREILTSNMYKDFLPLMKLPEKIKVLDLGANNGGFPLLLKSAGIKIEKLVCVELNPQTFSRLQFNINRNFENGFYVENSAVTGTERIVEIKMGRGGVDNNIYQNDSSEGELLKFKGITFDGIFTEYFDGQIVDLCKMDIESAEFEIFENNNHNKIKNCRYLLMEIHHNKQNNRKIVIDRLTELEFTEIDGENKDGNTHYVHLFENKNI